MTTNFIQTNYRSMPALCLDMDGTVRVTQSGETFPVNINDQKLNIGIEDKIKQYVDDGYIVLGFTNQGGVAHGFKTQEKADVENKITMALFEENPFCYIYTSFCDENGSVAPYNRRSLLRKPNIGMLAIAENDLWVQGVLIDWDNSLFVGDRPEDEATAKNAGIKFLHISEFLNEK